MTFYAVETESGSWYLLELKSRRFRDPVWKLITKKCTFFVIGLMLLERNPLPVGKITSIEQFRGQQICFDKNKKAALTIILAHTNIISRVVEFK